MGAPGGWAAVRWRALAAIFAGATLLGASCNPDVDPEPPFGPAQFRIYRTDRLDPSINDTCFQEEILQNVLWSNRINFRILLVFPIHAMLLLSM